MMTLLIAMIAMAINDKNPKGLFVASMLASIVVDVVATVALLAILFQL